MRSLVSRSGAFAPAALVLVASLAAATAGANAQNQLETPAPAASTAEAEPEIRFVPGEVVQQVPAPAAAADAAPQPSSLAALVTSTDNAALSPEEECLAQAVYFEARGESLAGQLAVAQVIINRADSGQFPSDYCGVVRQPSQFSFVRGGHIPSPNTGSLAWERARAIARIAHDGLWESAAGDALYFHASHVRPAWTRTKTARATIERHVFYR